MREDNYKKVDWLHWFFRLSSAADENVVTREQKCIFTARQSWIWTVICKVLNTSYMLKNILKSFIVTQMWQKYLSWLL